MMTMYKQAIGVMASLLLAGGAQAASISSMSITDFGFAMNHTNAAEGGTDDSSALSINLPLNMGSYQGVATQDGTNADKSTGIVGFDFLFFGPVAAVTQADDTLGTGGTVPTPSGDITGTTMTLDLSSWTAFWNGTFFNQGATTAGDLTVDTLTDNGDGTYGYTIIWTKLISGGPPFGGQTGHWWASGTASTATTVIPVPAAVWLFGSGLLGLVGVARRKANSQS